MTTPHHTSVDFSFDQGIQILDAAGSWMAAIGTILAACVALWLARRVETVRLKAYADLAVFFDDIGGKPTRVFRLEVTNTGERAVIVRSTGWKVGKGKSTRHCINKQLVAPARLEHGETAMLMIDSDKHEHWKSFARAFIKDGSDKSLNTLRAEIHTSTGHTETVVSHQSFLDFLKPYFEGDGSEGG